MSILPQHQPAALYAAFDLYPSAKGAATHIFHFAQTLLSNGGWLHVLGNPETPAYQREENPNRTTIEITRFETPIPNYLQRATAYAEDLFLGIKSQKNLQIVHFRDIWSGWAALSQKNKTFKTIFEVNALPSIELPYRYPFMEAQTLAKIKHIEEFCLQNASHIVVPSAVIRNFLIKKGVPDANITVIHNGADLQTNRRVRPAGSDGSPYLIYFGALQTWQGVNVLLNAFTALNDLPNLNLMICASTHPRQHKYLKKLAEKLNSSQKIVWHYQLAKDELYEKIANAVLSVAPLTECSRNIEQGCCPLKILESMACGTPVVASDLPVVREIMADNHGKLVRPNRPREFARAIRFLLENETLCQQMGNAAQQHINQHFTWDIQKAKLKKLLENL